MSLDMTLTFATQGDAGVDLYEEHYQAGTPFHLVFTDIRMPPGIDGVETSRRIKSIDPQAKIAICSAYTDYTYDEMIAHIGTDEGITYISKILGSVIIKNVIAQFGL